MLYAMPKNNNNIYIIIVIVIVETMLDKICINRKIRLFVLAFGFSLTRVRCVAIQ